MKHNILKNFLFVCFAIIFVFGSCTQVIKKIKEENIDKEKVEKAEEFANDFLESLKRGDYYHFTDEAIKDFILKLTPEFQKKTYSEIANQFGDFVRLDYEETWLKKVDNELTIVRFKGTFEKHIKPLEIRVVIDKNNKISGFWIKPWKKNLNLY